MRDCLLKSMVSPAIWAVLSIATPPTLVKAGESLPSFVGSSSCASSSCHGGAGPKRNQNSIWNKFDFHSRAYAILTTARSSRIAETLKIKSATESGQCTICHAPFQAVFPARLAKSTHSDEGVSCESCHGGAESWLRSHTRPDFTHRDRVNSGMRELRSAYSRANACVACHETIEAAITEAGHPQLIFELDSQLISQPPHWQDSDTWRGPRAWLTGQAVALREQSQGGSTCSAPRVRALEWLLRKVSQNVAGLPKPPVIEINQGAHEFPRLQRWADDLGRAAEDVAWSSPECLKLLKALANADFDATPDLSEQTRRAEALVQALDRLAVALKKNGTKIVGADQALAFLFADVRDSHAFEPAGFAQHLKAFERLISINPPTP